MTNNTEMSKKDSAWRSPWVLGWIGLLVAFLIANGTMVYLAVKSRPNLVVKDYYERGRDYEKHLLDRMARDPGWKTKIEAPDDVGVNEPSTFRFVVLDEKGQPVRPDAVVFHAYRPSDSRRDFSVPMREDTKGHYVAEISFPLKGVWDIIVSATHGKDEYNTSYRLSAGVKYSPMVD